ncbi:hypothetical protein GBAR_LOCUS19207 [Geodia barretti]|uniref:Uncharacterized protein n=1 Tax=Geodia barretti TaxID=519541 RepID=A0AA35SR42_GEOBA|nr:hypothetical protein GBAR_LOCUS19207 [Geodia barretti]
MLAPPPEAVESRDRGALDDAGRQHYLDSLERRLGKLEGGGGSGRKNQLSSKDILQSLSEAKDDHMQQRGTEVSRNGPHSSSWSGGGGGSGTGRQSPFSIRNDFADVDLSSGVSVIGEVEGGRGKRVGMEGGGEERPVSGSSIWTCCFRCQGGGGRRGGYSRAGRGGYEVDEDRSRLVDCDELSLEWQSQDINDIT